MCWWLRVVFVESGCRVQTFRAGVPENAEICPLARTPMDMCVQTLRHIKVLVIPDGLRKIGDHWFSCSAVEDVTIPASVIEIGVEAFYRCTGLRKVTFAEESALWKAGEACFMESGLEEISIPPKVEVIREYSFCDCKRLRAVRFTYGCLLRRV